MERENKAELMRRWREEQKEKKKAIKKAHYEKNRKELIQKAVERKQQKAVALKTRAQSRKITKGGNGKSTARVRKFRQNKAEEEEKKRAQSRERSKKYRDKKKAAEMVVDTDETDPVETPDMAVFKSRMAKKRAVDKTRKVLPATPNKKVEVVEKLVHVMEKKAVLKNPSSSRNTSL